MIELDTLAPWEPPEWPSTRRPASRVLAAAAVLAAVFALVTVGQRAAGYAAAFTINGSGMVNMLADDRALYLLRQVNLDVSIVDAYSVSDGHPIWSHRMGRANALIDVGRGVLLLHVPAAGESDQAPSVAVALDIHDGHELWRRAGYAPTFYNTTAAIGVLVVRPFVPDADADPNQPAQPSHLDALDVRTGATVWSRTTPAGVAQAYLTPHDAPDGDDYNIGELDPDGTLRIIDAQTGRVTRTAHAPNPGAFQVFDVSGDLMMATRFGPVGPLGITVFDLISGRQLWTQSLSEESEPYSWCGPVLCSYDGTRTVVVEPRTGQELWHTAPSVHWWPLDGTHVLTVGGAPPAAREWPTSGAVNDARTGAVLRDLRTWQVNAIRAWPDLVVLGRDGTEGAVVGLMDATTGHTTVFGRLGRQYAVPSCGVVGDLFLCEAGTDLSAFPIPARPG